jgi:hypothetical protein
MKKKGGGKAPLKLKDVIKPFPVSLLIDFKQAITYNLAITYSEVALSF